MCDSGEGGRVGGRSPAICTVGKANLMPLASKDFLIMARAFRRMTNCSPGNVIIFNRICTAKSPNASTPCIFNGRMVERHELRVLRQLQPNLLDQLSCALEIAVIGDADLLSITQSRLWF